MRSERARRWAFKVLVFFASISGVLLVTFLLQSILGFELPFYQNSVIGFVTGWVVNQYFNREQIAKASDPYSPENRARWTARLISDARPKK